MSTFLDNTNRKLIPRWRSFTTTTMLNELGDKRNTKQDNEKDKNDLNKQLEVWNADKGIHLATDLISSGFVLGEFDLVKEPAKYVIENKDKTSNLSVKIAELILGVIPDEEKVISGYEFDDGRGKIRKIKARLNIEPRDGILWTELAREYTIQGLMEKAETAMDYAVKLYPSNRFIIRAAVRFFVHNKEAEKAYGLLLRSKSLSTDPWLLASELAVSSLLGRSSKYVKSARQVIESGKYSDYSLSELMGAIATVELAEGNNKRSKRMFNQALQNPTDNSVAQAEWASRLLSDFHLIKQNFEVPYSFEARALENYFSGDWNATMAETRKWIYDQPFSSRPAIMASFIKSSIEEKYNESISFIKSSLISNPNDPILLNNLCFSYASLGQIEEAKKWFKKISVQQLSTSSLIAYTATKGLLEFRDGRIEDGRSTYEQAISLANTLQLPKYKALASIFLSREEILSKSGNDLTSFKRAEKYSKDLKDKDVIVLLKNLEKKLDIV